jgi:aspartate aminotransferase
VISPDVLRALAQALVEENAGRARPCMLLFDQVYWMLTAEGVQHANPVALVPECAPYVIQVDAISKCFAATGLRLGWGVLPPALQRSMKSLIGHIGAWAPKPEQLATARFLRQPGAMADYLDSMRSAVNQRLYALYDGVMALKAEGLPVDAVAPQGAIYLSFRVNLVGRKGFADNEAIRLFLLDKAGVGAVPFQAFDHQQDDGWFRLSVGAVGMDDIEGALARLQAALRDALPST